MNSKAAAAGRISEELKLIKNTVPGVRGSIAATSDGLLIAHDMHDMEPTQIAALVAALHAVSVRATLSTDSGQFKDVTIRAGDGYLAVFAAGRTAIVAVLGTTSLNVAILNYQARTMIERVAEVSAGLARQPAPEPGYEDPGYEYPAYETPSYETPGYETPGYETPGYETPGYEDPAQAPAADETGLPVRRRRR